MDLDLLGHQPALHRLYTHVCLVHGRADGAAALLRNGLDALAASFPWLAGRVCHDTADAGVTGTYRIVRTDAIPLIECDLRARALAVADLCPAGFPIRLLDETVLAPCRTFNPPGQHAGLVAETGPVFAVQLNLLVDGVVLTFAGQHNAMDMVGQAAVMRWLAQACRGQAPDADAVAVGNSDRTRTVPLVPDGDFAQLERPLKRRPPAPPGDTLWAYVSLSAAAVRALKAEATADALAATGVDFVSSDDVVSAFIWRSVARARLARLNPSTLSTLARAVDARPALGVSPLYPGALSNMVYAQKSLDGLLAEPLGATAGDLRRLLSPPAIARATRELATYISQRRGVQRVAVAAAVDPTTGVMLSSWAKLGLYDLDFGLGRPLAVRRPRSAPVEGLGYVMPRAADGATVVALCLRSDDWDRLGCDAGWTASVSFLG
ncbi:transferase family-domain-containing protein [Dipodascopsis tothii]|uniref:transferase family-domain-containing protein n=1 Tax=Dipodascopsis tothii TaxID=44089 RepID=UPI0034CF3205